MRVERLSDRRSWTDWLLDNWQNRLIAAFMGFFLLQYILWIEEEGIWFDLTVHLSKATLLLTVLVELLPRIKRLTRTGLQLGAVVLWHGYILGYEPVFRKVHTWPSLIGLIQENVMQVSPYVWFSLGTLTVYLFALWCVKTRWRIYTIIATSVFVFAVRDSYSLLVLWDQVAAQLFSGLLVLVIHHFAELKKKNPKGWAQLAGNPWSVAVPAVFLVSAAIILGTLAPEFHPLLTDPYTLWKNYKGETFTTSGKGIGLATSEAEGVASGYSRNDSELGGAFNFDYEPVFNVKTTYRSYWRGETRSFYTGKGWDLTAQEKNGSLLPVVSGETLAEDARVNASQLKTVQVTQMVTFAEKKENFPVLFTAAFAQKVVGVEKNQFQPLRWAPRYAELRWNERAGQKYPATYTVISQMPVIDEAGLRKSSFDLPRGEWADYLQLPNSLPARVRELARDITKNADNPYDKVKLLETYFHTNFIYTNNPDEGKGKSRDFVDRFLFEIEEGYCDYFSTAFTVMTRTLGVPARWVKGYVPGNPMLNGEELPLDMLDAVGSGEYTVRNADAHSWVEVYFPGWGWIPFEPTPGFQLPTLTPQNEEALQTQSNAEETAASLLPSSDIHVKAAFAAVIVLIVFAFIWGWKQKHRWRFLRSIPLLQGDSGHAVNRRVMFEFEQMLRLARRKGFVRKEYETVRETLRRWIRQNGSLQPDLETLFAVFEKAKYGHVPVSPEDAESAELAAKRLREQLRK